MFCRYSYIYLHQVFIICNGGCGLVLIDLPTGLILSLRPANKRRRYFVTTFLIGWVRAYNQPCTHLLYSHSSGTGLWSYTTDTAPTKCTSATIRFELCCRHDTLTNLVNSYRWWASYHIRVMVMKWRIVPPICDVCVLKVIIRTNGLFIPLFSRLIYLRPRDLVTLPWRYHKSTDKFSSWKSFTAVTCTQNSIKICILKFLFEFVCHILTGNGNRHYIPQHT